MFAEWGVGVDIEGLPPLSSWRVLVRNLFRTCRVRPKRDRDWWAYFGSFGDDFFGDDMVDEAHSCSTLSALTAESSR